MAFKYIDLIFAEPYLKSILINEVKKVVFQYMISELSELNVGKWVKILIVRLKSAIRKQLLKHLLHAILANTFPNK